MGIQSIENILEGRAAEENLTISKVAIVLILGGIKHLLLLYFLRVYFLYMTYCLFYASLVFFMCDILQNCCN